MRPIEPSAREFCRFNWRRDGERNDIRPARQAYLCRGSSRDGRVGPSPSAGARKLHGFVDRSRRARPYAGGPSRLSTAARNFSSSRAFRATFASFPKLGVADVRTRRLWVADVPCLRGSGIIRAIRRQFAPLRRYCRFPQSTEIPKDIPADSERTSARSAHSLTISQHNLSRLSDADCQRHNCLRPT